MFKKSKKVKSPKMLTNFIKGKKMSKKVKNVGKIEKR